MALMALPIWLAGRHHITLHAAINNILTHRYCSTGWSFTLWQIAASYLSTTLIFQAHMLQVRLLCRDRTFMTASKVCCVHSVTSVSDTKTPTGTKQSTVYSLCQTQSALSQPRVVHTYHSSYSCMQALCNYRMSLACLKQQLSTRSSSPH